MRLISLKLKGAIGIRKGMGLEEIEINFDQFSSGLVTLTGKNGSGKTTVMENLHPYRRLVSRIGKLSDHFELKDSYRILKFEYKGNTYESKIFIDALTDSSEAYLFKNNVPVNADGKVTSYDTEVEKLLGSEKLFFNSVFSGQKSRGIAALKPAERRELFYELLSLDNYELYCQRAKKALQTEELKLATVEGEIKVLREDVERMEVSELDIKELRYLGLGLKEKIKQKQLEEKELESSIEILRTNIANMKIKIQAEESVKTDIAGKEKEKNTYTENYNIDLSKINGEEENTLLSFDLSNESSKKIELIKKEQEETEEKFKKEENIIYDQQTDIDNEISCLNEHINKKNSNISRAKKILQNKEIIENTIKEKQGLSVKAANLTTSKNDLLLKINVLQVEEKAAVEEKNKLKNKQQALYTELSIAENELYTFEEEVTRLTTERDNKVAELNIEIENISKVQYSDNCKVCFYLNKAHDNKKSLPVLLAEYNDKISQILNKKEHTKYEIGEKEREQIHVNSDLAQLISEIEVKYINPITEFTAKINIIDKELKEIASRLVEINKSNWENLNEELQSAEKEISKMEIEISGLKDLAEEKRKSKIALSQQKISIQHQIEGAKRNSKEKITALTLAANNERAAIVKEYSNKKGNLHNNFDANIIRLEKEIKALKAKLFPALDLILIKVEDALEKNMIALESLKKDIEESISLQQQQIIKITEMENQLVEKVRKQDDINAKEAEISFINKEIKEYGFLVKAYDKTGIPVLKLENTATLITSIVNELLGLFDNQFRIVFETTSLTKKDKKIKEVFEINVIDEDGVCELANKSGGQQVWIETAIQLAIAQITRDQGKNIQTAFFDEKDGALDIDNANHYVEMIRQAHERSHVYNTLVITHRSEILEIIPQKIVFGEDQIKCVNQYN